MGQAVTQWPQVMHPFSIFSTVVGKPVIGNPSPSAMIPTGHALAQQPHRLHLLSSIVISPMVSSRDHPCHPAHAFIWSMSRLIPSTERSI
jgi:hypothetical protein